MSDMSRAKEMKTKNRHVLLPLQFDSVTISHPHDSEYIQYFKYNTRLLKSGMFASHGNTKFAFERNELMVCCLECVTKTF